MLFKKTSVTGLGLMAALSLSACDYELIETLPGASISAPSVEVPVQRVRATPSPKTRSSRSRTQRAQPSQQIAAAPRQTASKPLPQVAAPTAVSPAKTDELTAESCAIKQVAGCAFILTSGGNGEGNGFANDDPGGGGGQGGWGGGWGG